MGSRSSYFPSYSAGALPPAADPRPPAPSYGANGKYSAAVPQLAGPPAAAAPQGISITTQPLTADQLHIHISAGGSASHPHDACVKYVHEQLAPIYARLAELERLESARAMAAMQVVKPPPPPRQCELRFAAYGQLDAAANGAIEAMVSMLHAAVAPDELKPRLVRSEADAPMVVFYYLVTRPDNNLAKFRPPASRHGVPHPALVLLNPSPEENRLNIERLRREEMWDPNAIFKFDPEYVSEDEQRSQLERVVTYVRKHYWKDAR